MMQGPTDKQLAFARWLDALKARQERGRLAALRRGLMLEEEMLFTLCSDVPPNFLAGLSQGEERHYLMVAALFAYHPCSFGEEERHRNLGDSLWLLARKRQAGDEDELPEPLRRRMEACWRAHAAICSGIFGRSSACSRGQRCRWTGRNCSATCAGGSIVGIRCSGTGAGRFMWGIWTREGKRTMYLELHLLQNFALSNLNRDDTGAPKSCMFGGTRRARISSQCLKRAVRTHFREEGLVPSDLLARRTKWLQRALAGRLTAVGMPQDAAGQTATRALELLEFKLDKGKTEYLLLLGEREIEGLAALCREHAEELLAASGKASKKESKSELPARLLAAIDGGDALDIALFGRMIATHAAKNVDAAVQMAHAFSTHPVANEFDFFSAVEELKEADDDDGAGAGMLGTTLYNSSCYYRYTNLDLEQLRRNLGGDGAQAVGAASGHVATAVRAFVAGCIAAVPSGKGTNSAPQNPPAFILAVVRERGLWSLANAFVQPVFAGGGDLVQESASRLVQHWQQLAGMYGTAGVRYAGMATYLTVDAAGLSQEANVGALVDRVMAQLLN